MEKEAIVRLFEALDVKAVMMYRLTCPHCDEDGDWWDDDTAAVEDLVDHIDNEHDGKEE